MKDDHWVEERNRLADKKILYCMKVTLGVLGVILAINLLMYVIKADYVSRGLQLGRVITAAIGELMIFSTVPDSRQKR